MFTEKMGSNKERYGMKIELNEAIKELGITQVETARLLLVNDRTVRRWCKNPGTLSGPAEKAIEAWLRLKRIDMPWRPDGKDGCIVGRTGVQGGYVVFRNVIEEPLGPRVEKVLYENLWDLY